ncbi:uncharacterized protein TC_0305-like [Ruditapes philippinarum]|uniref:uncharacterized protein TC_0305-like n=1 Tax=Ruditapes philippinarum TaxID=129788 RepID=UPI00295C25A3|nr:uncharacterized protein TC_0305-like [Ruditapes philippinarum]
MESGNKTSKESQLWESQVSNGMPLNTKVYFNGGCYFKIDEERISDDTTVLSRYLDLPDSPAAIVRCQVQAGIAVLSGAHLEYDSEDIDDGDEDVLDIIPVLRETSKDRQSVIKSLLQQLNITVK